MTVRHAEPQNGDKFKTVKECEATRRQCMSNWRWLIGILAAITIAGISSIVGVSYSAARAQAMQSEQIARLSKENDRQDEDLQTIKADLKEIIRLLYEIQNRKQ